MSRFDSFGGSGILPKGDQDNKVSNIESANYCFR